MTAEEKLKVYAGILERVMDTLRQRVHSAWAHELLAWINKELHKVA